MPEELVRGSSVGPDGEYAETGLSASYALSHMGEAPPCGKVHVVAVQGEIDPGAVIGMQRGISAAFDAGCRRVVIDLRMVTLVLGDQTADMFCGVLRRRAGRSASLAIVACPLQVQRILALSAIDNIELYPDVDVATSALTAQPASAA